MDDTGGAALKQQYLAVAVAQAELRLAQEARDAARQTVEVVRRRVAAGSAAETDALKVETDSLQLEDQSDAAALALQKAKLDLAFLLGARTSVPAFAVDDALLKNAAHPIADMPENASLLREALARRSDVLSAEYGLRRARAAETLARRTRWPDVALWVNYVMQGSGSNAITPPTVTIGIDAALPLFYQNQGEIEKSRADVFARRVRRAKVESQVVNDVESALSALQIARTRLARMGGTLLDDARRARSLTVLQYERGAASLLELLDSQRTFLSINASHLQSVADYWSAVFTVEQATGRKLR